MPRRTPRAPLAPTAGPRTARPRGGRPRASSRAAEARRFLAGLEGLEARTLMAGGMLQDLALTPAEQSAITSAVAQLGSYGVDVNSGPIAAALATNIPVLNRSVDGLLAQSGAAGNATGGHFGDFLQLAGAANTYFTSTGSPTASGLASALSTKALSLVGGSATGSLPGGASYSVTGGFDPATDLLSFHVVFGMSRDAGLVPISLGADAANLGLAVDASAKVDVSANVNVDATVGIDLTSYLANPGGGIGEQAAYVQLDNASAGVNVHATGLNFNLTAGMLQAGVVNGTADLSATGVLAIQKQDGTKKVSLYDLDSAHNPNAPGLAGLVHFSTPATDANNNPINNLALVLPVQASLGSFRTPTDPASIPTVTVSDTDVFTTAPIVSEQHFADLAGFSNITPAQVLGLLDELGNFLDEYRKSPVFGVAIPFTSGTTLGSLLDLGNSFTTKLTDGLQQTNPVSLTGMGDVPADFALSTEAQFSLSVDGQVPVLVSVPATPAGATGRTIGSLVADVQAAVNTAGLGGAVLVGHAGNAITLTRTGNSADRGISIAGPMGSAMTELHFGDGQQTNTPTNAPLFATIQGLVNALTQELGVTAVINPQYDPATKSVSFHVRWSDAFTSPSVPLDFNLSLGDLGSVTTTGQAGLGADVTFDFTFGFNLARTGNPQLAGTLANSLPANGRLAGAATFAVTLGTQAPVTVTIPAAATAGDNSVADLLGVINAAIAGTSLKGLVQATVKGGVVVLATTSATTLPLTVAAPLTLPGVTVPLVNPAVAQLGLPGDGNLGATSTFTLSDGVNDLGTLTIPSGGNTRMANPQDPLDPATLVGEINRALMAAGLLTSASYDPATHQTTYAGKVYADTPGGSLANILRFNAVTGSGLSHLKIKVAATDPMATVLGFADGQTASGTVGDIFISTTPLIAAHAGLSATGFGATAQFGPVQVTATNGTARADAYLSLGLHDPANPTASTVSLATLVHEFGQRDFSGIASVKLDGSGEFSLGGLSVAGISLPQPAGSAAIAVTLPNLQAATDTLNFNSGVLAGPASFAVTLPGQVPVTVTVPQSATAGDTSMEDLAAKVNAAIQAAGLGSAVAARVDAGAITFLSLGTAGATVANITGFAPTGILAGDATFTVTVGTTAPVTLTVKQADTAGDGSLADLAAKVNAALGAAGIGAKVQAVVNGAEIQFVPLPQGSATAVAVSGFYTLSTPALGSLLDLRHISVTSVIAGLQSVAHLIDAADPANGSSQLAFLNVKLPLIGKSAKDLVDYASSFLSRIDAVAQDPAGSLQALQTALDNALGISPTSPEQVTLAYDTSIAGHPALKVGLTYTQTYDNEANFSLDLPGLARLVNAPSAAVTALENLASLVDTDLAANLHVNAYAKLALEFGIDLTNPLAPKPFLYDGSPTAGGTGVTLGVEVDGTGLNFKAALGPIGIFVTNGTVSLGSSTTADHHAQFSVSILDADGTGRHYLTDPIAADFTVGLVGSVTATLPLYGPTSDLPIGGAGHNNLVLSVPNLQALLTGSGIAGSVSITTPDISALAVPNPIALLRNPAILVDGLDSALGGLQSALDSQVLQTSLPVVGSALASSDQFITDFRQGVLAKIQATLASLPNGDPTLALANAMTAFFGSGNGGLGLLAPGSTVTTTTDSVNNPTLVQFNMHLHKDVTFRQQFNLGLSAVGLSLDGTGAVMVSLGYDFYFDFGVSTKYGLYVVTNPTNDGATGSVFRITAVATTPGLDVTGTLGFLQVRATDGQGASQVVLTPLQAGLTGVTASYVVSNSLAPGHETVAYNAAAQTLVITIAPGSTAGGVVAAINADPAVKFLFGAAVGGTAQSSAAIDTTIAPGRGTSLIGSFVVNLTDPKQPTTPLSANDGDHFLAATDLIGASFAQVVQPTATFAADVNLHLLVDIKDGSGNAAEFPSIQTDFHLGWGIAVGQGGLTTGKPTVDFDKVQLDLGSFISDFVAPIVQDVKKVLDPIKPIIDILTTPLPVISDLAGHDVTLEDLAALFGSPYSQIKTFTDAYNAIYSIINSIPSNPGDILIGLGDFHFGGAADDLTGKGQLPATADSQTTMADPTDQISDSSTKNFATQLNHSAEFTLKFPLLSHEAPQTILALLTGRTADLFEFDMTELKLGFNYRQIFPIFGPLAATLGGSISADIKFAFGYDTTGVQEAIRDKSQGAAVIARDLADGFYIRTDDGPQITLDGDIVAGAALSLEIATGGVEGGVFAHITASLVDPDGTGKLRYQEIQHLVDPDGKIADIMPLCLFDIAGNLSFKLYAYVDAGPIHYQANIVDPITLLSFSLMCPGDPILSAEDLQGALNLNLGPRAANRTYGDVADDNETMHVATDAKNPASVDVTYYKADGSQVQKNDGTGPLAENHASVTNVVADGGAGNNTIDVSGTALPATLSAGNGNNTIVAGAGTTTVALGNGNNAIRVGDGNNTITAGSGNNAITIGAGIDAIRVGPGYDTITESGTASAQDTLTVSGAAKYVLTPTSIESLDAGGNVVGILTVVDARGNPVPLNTFASITLDGAAGDDTFDVSRWTSGGLTLVGSGNGGTDTVLSDNSATAGALTFGLADNSLTRSDGASIALTNINRARLTGSQGTDVFNVNGWTGTAFLTGGPGSSAHNTFNVTGSRATLPAVTIVGDGGTDALNFTLNGDAAAGTDPSIVSTSAVPIIHFTNADAGNAETWTLDRGGLSAGGRALLATVGATNSTFTFGADANTITVLDVATATTIDAHAGTNVLRVGDATHPIREIAAPLVILGNPANDTLTVDDEANNNNSTDLNNGPLATGEVDALTGQTALGQPVPGQVIGLGMASSGRAGLIQFDAKSLAVTLGTGANALTVRGTTVPVAIAGQQAPTGGSVGNNAITILAAAAPVSVAGGGGQDTLTLDRTADAAAYTAGLLNYQNGLGTISGLGASTVTYQGLTHLVVKLGTGNSQLTVVNSMAHSGADSTVINTNTADDQVTVRAVGDSTTVVGQPGKDTVTVNFTTLSPRARQFQNLHLAPVHLLVVDNTGPAVGRQWTYTAGQYFANGETKSTDYVVDSAGADSSRLAEGHGSELDITNTVPTDQTATVQPGQAQLGVGSTVLTPVANGFVQGAGGLGYVTTADGLYGSDGSVTSPDGKFLYVISRADASDGTSGSIAVYAVVPATGKLIYLDAIKYGSGAARAQGVEHAVAVAMSPDGKQVYVLGDLGVGVYNRDASTGLLSLNSVAADPSLPGGTSLAVSPDGLDVFVAVPGQDLVVGFKRDPNAGTLTYFGADFNGHSTTPLAAETIQITADGKYVYAVNDGFGATFDVFQRDLIPGDRNYGLLDEIGPEAVAVPTATTTSGATLRSFSLNFVATSRLMAVSPDGRFAYVASDPGNGRGGEVRAYRRDPQTGDFSELITTFSDYGQDQYGLQGATQLVVGPDGLNLYVVGGLAYSNNTQHDHITDFTIDPQTGALTYQETLGVGSPYTNFEQTLGIAVSPDSNYVFAVSSNGAFVEQFSRDDFKEKLHGYTQIRTGLTGYLYSVGASIAVSPDDKWLYVESYQTNTVLGYALNSNGLLPGGNPNPNFTFQSINSDGLFVAADPNGFAMSPDGSLLYMATTDGEVRVDVRGSGGQLTNVAHLPAPGFAPRDTAVAVSPDSQRVYVTYTRADGSTLLEVYRRNPGNSFTAASGSDQEDGGLPFATATNPAISPDGYVYVASESSAGVAVLKDDGTGILSYIQSMAPGQGGALIAGATSLAAGADGKTAYVAGPGSNGLAVFRQYSGSAAPDTYVAQWLADGVVLNGHAVTGLNGAGPVGASPDGKELYVIGTTEDGGDATGGTLAVFAIDPASGLLTGEVQTLTNANFYQASSVSVSTDGAWVDVLGASKNVLVRYHRAAGTGLLSIPQTIHDGTTTAGLQDLAAVTLSPDGSFAYALAPDDGGLVVFARDAATGKLDLASGQPLQILFDGETLTVPAGGTAPRTITPTPTAGLAGAVAMTLSPDGRQLFVVSPVENTLAVFDRDPATGLLTFRAVFRDTVNNVFGLTGANAVAVSGDGRTILVQGPGVQAEAAFARVATAGDPNFGAITSLGAFGDSQTGAGPVAFSPEPGVRVAYFANAAAGSLSAYGVDTAGNLTPLATYANGQVVNGQAIAGLGGASAIAFSPDGRYLFVAGAGDNALVVFTRNPTTGLLTFSQELREGVDGVQGLGGAAAVAASPVYADTNAQGQPVNDQFVFVAGRAENELAVFGIDTNPADANYGKFVFLQRLSNGAVAGLGTPNSVVVGPNRTVYVGSGTGTSGTGGGVALFTIAASVPPPTQYTIAYTGLSTFKLTSGAGNDTLDVLGTPAGIATTFNTGTGVDLINFQGLGVAGADDTGTTVALKDENGAAASETVNVRSTNTGARLQVDTGGGADHVYVWATGLGSTTTLNTQSSTETVQVLGTGLLANTQVPTTLTVNNAHALLFDPGGNALDAAKTTYTNGAIRQVTGTVGVLDGQGHHYATVAYNNITNPNVQILTPPTASITGAGPIAEGQPLTLAASTSQVNVGTYTYAWDLNGNGEFNQAFGANPTITWADLVRLGISKDGSYPIHLRVTDPQGRVAEATATLAVTRTAPSLSISSNQGTIHVGDAYTLAVQLTRPGSEGVTSLTINWGDGTANSTFAAIPAQATHTYAGTSNAAGFPVTATLVDSEGVTTTSNTLHVVSSIFNRAPVASAGGAYTIAEGGTLVLDGSGTTNPDGNTLTYRWSINGHNSTNQGSPTLSVPWATLVSTYGVTHFTAGVNVTLTVTDDHAHTSKASTTLAVTATTPTVSATAGGATAVTVAEGQSLTLNLGFAAFGQGDNLKSWTINWGDGTTSNLGAVTSAKHTYTVAPREYQVVATAADSLKNSIAANPVDVVVSTVAPTLTFGGPASTFANAPYTLTLAAAAVDAAGLGAWTINWGDGTSSAAAGGATAASHTYTTPAAAANISAQEVYEGTTYNARRLNSSLYVEPVAVVAQGPANLALSPGSASVAEGGTLALGGSFTDANAAVAHTVAINWGDGTSSTLSLPAGTTTFNPTHQYLDNPAGQPAGSDSIQVTVAQPSFVILGRTIPGPSTTGTASIQVANVAPTQVSVTAAPAKVTVGGSVSVSGSFADPGTLDTHAVDIKWGDGTPDTFLTLGAGVLAIPATGHTYGVIGDGLSTRTLPVTVTVTDKDGGGGGTGAAVEVDNLATSLAASAAAGTYGGTATLSATLTSGSLPVVGQVVSFTLGGKPAGTAVTDANGLASLPRIPLGNLGVGTYAGRVGASFGPATGYAAQAATAALTVTPAPLTVTTNPASRPVGAPDPAFGVTYSGFVAGDGPAVLGGTLAYTSTANAASGAGSYTVTPSGLTARNYAIRYVGGTLTVGKVHLTVTVNDADMGHGDPVPTLSYSLSGFVNGDTAAVVSGAAALQAAATSTSPAGRYAITAGAGTLSAANYDFTFVPGTLTVHPKVTDVRVDWGTRSISLIGLNRDLPFVDITAIDVLFSDDVAVTAAELALQSTIPGSPAYGFTKFSYNPATHDATWTLPSALGIDSLMLALNGPVSSGAAAIPLAGASAWNFSVLPGDFNADGVVNSADLVGVRNQTPAFLGATVVPSPFADLDGDGAVDANDLAVVSRRVGTHKR